MFSVGDTVTITTDAIPATEGTIVSTTETHPFSLLLEYMEHEKHLGATRLTADGRIWCDDTKPLITKIEPVRFKL